MEKFTGIPVSFQLVWLLRILLSAFCGGLIGFERATQRKSAGLHTHVVVAIASTLFSIAHFQQRFLRSIANRLFDGHGNLLYRCRDHHGP